MMRGRNGRDSIPNLEIRLCRKAREYRRKLKSKPQWRDPCEYKEITVLLSKIVTLTRRVFGETSKNVYDSLVASSHVFMDLALDKLKKKQYEQSFDIAKCGLKLIPASAYRDPDRRYDTILSRFHLESIRLAASNIMKNQMQLVENIKRLGKCKSDSSKNIKKTKLDMVSSSPSSSHDIKTKITRRQERRPMTAKKTFGRTFSSASSARKLYGTPARTVKALRLVRTSGDASRRRPVDLKWEEIVHFYSYVVKMRNC